MSKIIEASIFSMHEKRRKIVISTVGQECKVQKNWTLPLAIWGNGLSFDKHTGQNSFQFGFCRTQSDCCCYWGLWHLINLIKSDNFYVILRYKGLFHKVNKYFATNYSSYKQGYLFKFWRKKSTLDIMSHFFGDFLLICL